MKKKIESLEKKDAVKNGLHQQYGLIFLKAQQEKILQEFDLMKRKQISVEEKSIRHYKKLLSFMNAWKAKKNLDKVDERLAYLTKKLRCEINKNTVLREVSRVYPQSLPLLSKNLDQLDEWWIKKEDYTIEAWARFLEQQLKKERELA
jgi:hypothetical protein